MDRLKDKAAIVTGSTSGIGTGIAKMFGAEGARVVVCGRNEERGAAVVDAIAEAGGTAWFHKLDITRPETVDALFADTKEKWGSIDVLVNNAGVACKQRLSILETTPESFERLMKVNCEGTFFLCQGGANRMIVCQRQNLEDYHPRIVNISSISAYTSSTNRGEYCISSSSPTSWPATASPCSRCGRASSPRT